ncbi:hypothetical protein Tco_0446244 [Tanacetum coccineum]
MVRSPRSNYTYKDRQDLATIQLYKIYKRFTSYDMNAIRLQQHTKGGLTLIFATLEDLDLGLLGDVISEDDCGDDGEDENVFVIGERCNLGDEH